MGRRAPVGSGVVQHKVFQLDQLAVQGHGSVRMDFLRS
jgi:hypothetical protein